MAARSRKAVLSALSMVEMHFNVIDTGECSMNLGEVKLFQEVKQEFEFSLRLLHSGSAHI